MKKQIIIDSETNKVIKNSKIKNSILEILLYTIGYTLVLIIISSIFHTHFYINHKYFGLYAFIGALIIRILNQTIKPILFYITLPLTAITYGLFYPILNVIILYITSFILNDNFTIHGPFISFFIAISISGLNFVIENILIKPIVKKGM